MQRSLEETKLQRVRAERSYRDYEDVSGESTEFEWNIFPGFTSLQLSDKISNLLSSLGQSPELSQGRILLMSMFNDISCDRYDNKDECLKNAEFVKTFAKYLELVNGLSLDHVLRKSGILPRIVHKEPGTILRKSYFPFNDSIVQRKVEKQRIRESVHTLQC